MGNERPFMYWNRIGNGRRLWFVVAAISLLAALLLARPFAALSDNTLFSPVTDATAAVGQPETARRARAVRLNRNALDRQADELRLNLFEDVTLTANLRRVDTSVTDGYVWVGDIAGEPGSVATLSVQDGVLAGSVHRFGREWVTIRPAGKVARDSDADALVYTIAELDPHAPQPNGADHVIPQPSAFEMQTLSPRGALCQEDGSVIDLMIVYTPAARDMAGGQAAIEALVNLRVSEMNTANDNSGAVFDWQLVNLMEVGYVESGNIATDLQYLQQSGDGVLDEVHGPRDTFKADLVAMLIDEGSNNACGYAYQMSSLGSWFQGYGFGVTAMDYPGPLMCGELTLAHEIGHNLGNAHNRAHATGAVLFPFSYGYQSPNQTFRDIMSYDCPNGCPRINQWANPDVWYMGEPTGVDFETDPANAADIVRSMHEARVLVSNFRVRDSCVEPTATPTSTPTDVPIPTDTPLPTDTFTPTATPTETLVPTETMTPTITPTPTTTSTPTVTPTGTVPTPSPTATPTATRRATQTPTPDPTTTPTKDEFPLFLYMPAVISG